MDGDCNSVYVTRVGVKGLSAVGDCVERWMHWTWRSAVLHRSMATYAGMPFNRGIAKKAYACRLALIVQNDSDLIDSSIVAHTL